MLFYSKWAKLSDDWLVEAELLFVMLEREVGAEFLCSNDWLLQEFGLISEFWLIYSMLATTKEQFVRN